MKLWWTACLTGLLFNSTACSRSAHPPPVRSPGSTPTVAFHCDEYIPTNPGWSCLQHAGKFAIRCSGYTTSSLPQGAQPPNYNVEDIGKTGVPMLTGAQRAMIERILLRLRPKPRHLRFAFVWKRIGPEFIVFNAFAGPCYMGAPGYHVLNDTRPSRNEFYQPGENPYYTHSIPGDTHPEQTDNY